MELHQTGKLLTCGAISQAMTVSRNSVSRASRGRFLRVASMVMGSGQCQGLQAVALMHFAAAGSNLDAHQTQTVL